ncbi:MAG: STAS domain-containing protein [Ferrovum sp.]|nr:STAS domain-containing protein [Ferrovum sp.]
MIKLEGQRLVLSGPLVMDSANTMLNEAKSVAASMDVTVDFSGVTDIDSSALALMLQWRREAEAAGRTVTFEGVPDNLRVLAELYGVSFLLDHHAIPD